MDCARDPLGDAAVETLAPGWRVWRFKYEGVCGADCGGAPLQPGETGFWNPQTKEVRHATCRPSADTDARRKLSPWTGLPAPRDEWQRLVAYSRACVLRESLTEPARYEDEGTVWAVVPGGPERILAGVNRSLKVSGRTTRVVAADHAADGEPAAPELAYGWPLVVCRDAAGTVRCAPLLICGVASPSVDAHTLTVDVDSAHLNIAVADPRFQPDGDPTILRMIADEPLPLGDPRALADRLTTIAVEAALTVHEPLDATAVPDGRPPASPGVYNRAVLLRRDESDATRSLLADLRAMFYAGKPQWQQTAAAWLVAGRPPTASRPLAVVSANSLNGSQEAAVHNALSSPVTVVTGPPGTGKSQFVAAVVATARDRGLTVLVASTNNGAVDEAVKRASAAHPAAILRTGNAEYRKELIGTLEGICRNIAAGADLDSARGSHRAMSARREHARGELEARALQLRRLDEIAADAARLADALWNGQQPTGASDPAAVLRRADRARAWWRRRARRKLLSDLNLHTHNSREILDDLIAWTQGTLQLRDAREQLDIPAGDDEWQRWRAADDAWQRSGSALIAAIAQNAIHEAGDRIDGLTAAHRQDTGTRRRAMLGLIDVLPAWATTAMSVRPNFACDAAIFDVVVIDEASQCTLPAVLPLAFRAKQIVIVGDPNQLPPVVTLSGDELDELPAIAGLDVGQLREHRQLFGTDSSYGAFRALVDGELLLDEHYRCHPRIAGFCDEEFYAGWLHVLSNTTRPAAPPVRGLSWIQVDGNALPGSKSGRINDAEAVAITDWVVEHAQALRASGNDLGVVTPFTAQARLLRATLARRVDAGTREQLNLRVGTAHTFQGAERDVMLFSTVITPGVPAGTVEWIERARYLVNVAVSRARLALVTFGDAAHLPSLGARTLASLYEHARSRSRREAPLSRAETALLAELPRDVDVRVSGTVADHSAPLSILTPSGTTLVVAVDHGQAEAAARLRELTIDHHMTAAGAEVLRIPAWLCRSDPRGPRKRSSRRDRGRRPDTVLSACAVGSRMPDGGNQSGVGRRRSSAAGTPRPLSSGEPPPTTPPRPLSRRGRCATAPNPATHSARPSRHAPPSATGHASYLDRRNPARPRHSRGSCTRTQP